MRRLLTQLFGARAFVPAVLFATGVTLAAAVFVIANGQSGQANEADAALESRISARSTVVALQNERSIAAQQADPSEVQAATDATMPTDTIEFTELLIAARNEANLELSIGHYNNLIGQWLDLAVAVDPALDRFGSAQDLSGLAGSLTALRESIVVEAATAVASPLDLNDAHELTDGWVDAAQLGTPGAVVDAVQSLLTPNALDELRDNEVAAIDGDAGSAMALAAVRDALLEQLAGLSDEIHTEARGVVAAGQADARRSMWMQPLAVLVATVVLIGLWTLLQWRMRRRNVAFGAAALAIADGDMVELLAAVDDGEIDEPLVFPVAAPPSLADAADAIIALQETAVNEALVRVSEHDRITGVVAESAHRSRQLIDAQEDVLADLEDDAATVSQSDSLVRMHHLVSRLAATNEQLLVLTGVARLPVGVVGAAPVSGAAFAAVRSSQNPGRVSVELHEDATVSAELGQDLVIILRELLDNALTFSARSLGVVLSGDVVDGAYSFWVIDQGIGAEAEELDTLNSDLEQRHSMSSVSQDGLGLAVVAELAERHELRVSLVANEDVGLQARVHVPARMIAGHGDSQWVAPPVALDEASTADDEQTAEGVKAPVELLQSDDADHGQVAPVVTVVRPPSVETAEADVVAVDDVGVPEPSALAVLQASFRSPEPLDDAAMRSSVSSLSHRLLISQHPADEIDDDAVDGSTLAG